MPTKMTQTDISRISNNFTRFPAIISIRLLLGVGEQPVSNLQKRVHHLHCKRTC